MPRKMKLRVMPRNRPSDQRRRHQQRCFPFLSEWIDTHNDLVWQDTMYPDAMWWMEVEVVAGLLASSADSFMFQQFWDRVRDRRLQQQGVSAQWSDRRHFRHFIGQCRLRYPHRPKTWFLENSPIELVAADGAGTLTGVVAERKMLIRRRTLFFYILCVCE